MRAEGGQPPVPERDPRPDISYQGLERRSANPVNTAVRRLERLSVTKSAAVLTLVMIVAAVACNLFVHLVIRNSFAPFVIWNPILIATVICYPTMYLMFSALEQVRNTRLTLRLHAEQEIANLERYSELGRGVAAITHDVATPLGSTLTAASVLKDRLTDLSAQVEQGELSQSGLSKFLADGTELSGLIESNSLRARDLMEALRRTSAEQATDAKRRVRLGDYVREVALSLMYLYPRNAHRIEVIVRDEIEMGIVPSKLSRVLMNLIKNALVHAFADDQAGLITVIVEREQADAVIRCIDNGDGIPEDVQARMFEEFFTTGADRGGTGIGLHSSRKLIESLAGTLEFSSRAGLGTEFTIRLPM